MPPPVRLVYLSTAMWSRWCGSSQNGKEAGGILEHFSAGTSVRGHRVGASRPLFDVGGDLRPSERVTDPAVGRRRGEDHSPDFAGGQHEGPTGIPFAHRGAEFVDL